MTMGKKTPKSTKWSKSSAKKEVQRNTSLPQETRKISNKQPRVLPIGLREITKKPKVSRRKEIIMIR